MGGRRIDDHMFDRALAFAHEHGLSVRSVPESAKGFPHGENAYTITLPKGELVIEVTFENSRRAAEWFVDARDSATSRLLWRSSSWEWDDVYGDAGQEDEIIEELAAQHLVEVLAAVLKDPVRLAQVTKRPFVRLFGWCWPSGTRTTLQLLRDGEWVEWGRIVYPDREA